MLADHREGLSSSSFYARSSIAQLVSQQAFSLLANRCLRPSGFESFFRQRKTTCLLSILKSLACARASKLTTTNMYIARARCECQNGSGVRWAECLLIKDTGCRVQVFKLDPRYLSQFVSRHSVCWWIGFWDPLGSNPAFSRGRQLVSFRFENRLPVPEHRN